MIIEYDDFEKIFNQTIFEKSKADLLEKIAQYPERYVGIFRPTKPKAKLLQNLLQSHEIRFGDAFEKIIEEYLKRLGATILEKTYTFQHEEINIDHCFLYNDNVFFIEQKIRDDHDSTKKRGQMGNYEKKLYKIVEKYKEKKVIGIFYFVDPDLKKNKNYYITELDKLSKDYQTDNHILYGQELFDFLKHPEVWQEILFHLKRWKEQLKDLPEVNFDIDADQSFQEIKNLEPFVFRKLFMNDVIYKDILLTLFPQRETLKKLLEYFKQKACDSKIYDTLYKLLYERIYS